MIKFTKEIALITAVSDRNIFFDNEKVANIHFAAGYVPSTQSKQSFALACRAIGESVLGKPANEVSIGNLLYRLLRTTEYFKMETQPQLLLLQKTMVVVEGCLLYTSDAADE